MKRAAAVLLASLTGAGSVPASAQGPTPSPSVPHRPIGAFDGGGAGPGGSVADARVPLDARTPDDGWISADARISADAWIAVNARSAQDAWIAEDKARHLFASLAITGVSFGLATASGLDWPDAGIAAGAVAGAAGLGKEVRDYRRGRPFSVKDLAWDAVGIAAGLALASASRR